MNNQVDIYFHESLAKNANIEHYSREFLQNALKFLQEFTFTNLKSKNLFVELTFTNMDDISQLNETWRNLKTPTNVLSFQNYSYDDLKSNLLPDIIFLGDMAICLEYATNEAKELNISLNDHLARLIAHGLLHLFGFNHESDNEAHQMLQLENELLANLLKKQINPITNNYWN